MYTRGHGRRPIFRADADFDKFLDLIARYLSDEGELTKSDKSLHDDLELMCYCLMDNHFHLLLYQKTEGSMSRLMRAVMTSYSMYFNRKYNLSGALFESRYRASRISSNPNLIHVSRYIHLSPKEWISYPHSSIHSYYLGAPDWLHPERVIELFGSLPMYADFLDDHIDYKESLEDIKDELANKIEE